MQQPSEENNQKTKIFARAPIVKGKKRNKSRRGVTILDEKGKQEKAIPLV